MPRGRIHAEARRAVLHLYDRWVYDVPGRRSREWKLIRKQRLDHLVPVAEPLVLISQVQRSGGTLLAQLLDAHPQVHAHPDELYIGAPDKRVWPSVDPSSSARELYQVLREIPAQRAFARGYTKYGKGAGETAVAHPFVLPPVLQRSLFEHLAPSADTRRSVLDAYFTSYFNAWLDNANLYDGPKRWISGFVPRLAMTGDSLDRYFADYPDGRLLTIVREPEAWYASARRHHEIYDDLDRAVGVWRASALAAISAASRWPDQVLVLRFEDLVGATESVMRGVARWLDIEWRPNLIEPSFNGRQIEADSSFPVGGFGVRTESLDRGQTLGAEDRRRIRDLVGDVHHRAVEAMPDVGAS